MPNAVNQEAMPLPVDRPAVPSSGLVTITPADLRALGEIPGQPPTGAPTEGFGPSTPAFGGPNGPFVMLNPKKDIPNTFRGPFPGGAFYNPYGFARGQKSYGRSGIFGGPEDMIKSIATRKLAIDTLMEQIGREPVPEGLMASLQRAAGGGLGGEAFSEITPGITSEFTKYEDSYKASLIDLLTKSYVLGGALYGSAYKNWALAKQTDKARRLEHAQSLQAIFSAIGGSIGGGSGGMGGGMGGGGGGGGSDYGITNTTVGLLGVLGKQGTL